MKEVRGLSGVALADAHGAVIEQAGNCDADTLCAVGMVAGGQLQAAGDALAAGRLKRWYLVTDRATVWVDQREDGLLVATGPAAKNPEPISSALGRR